MAIKLHKDGAVATITIDRPDKLNALSLQMYDDLGNAFAETRDDEAINVIVLTGHGSRAFCVGADLTESIPKLADGSFDISAWDPAHLKNMNFYKPIVSAIRGLCIGGGFEIMLATDIRVASEDANFQLPEPSLGFVPAGGTLVRLVRQIGYAHAMQIMLTAERFTANQLLSMGVVNEILPADEVLPRAYEIAAAIAKLSPNAIQTIKEAALTLQDIPLKEAFAREAELGQRTFTSQDAKEGLAMFANKPSKATGTKA